MRKIIFLNELGEFFADMRFADWSTGGRGKNYPVVMELRSKDGLHFILSLFVVNQHFRNTARKEDAANTAFRLGRFEDTDSFAEFTLGREDKKDVFSIKSFDGLL